MSWGWAAAEGWRWDCLGADPEGLWDGKSCGKVGRQRWRTTQFPHPLVGDFRPLITQALPPTRDLCGVKG